MQSISEKERRLQIDLASHPLTCDAKKPFFIGRMCVDWGNVDLNLWRLPHPQSGKNTVVPKKRKHPDPDTDNSSSSSCKINSSSIAKKIVKKRHKSRSSSAGQVPYSAASKLKIMLRVLQDHLSHDLTKDTTDETNEKPSRQSSIAKQFSSLLQKYPFATPTVQKKFKLHNFKKIFGQIHPQKKI